MLDLVEAWRIVEHMNDWSKQVHESSFEIGILRHYFEDWNSFPCLRLFNDALLIVLVVSLLFVKFSEHFAEQDVHVEINHFLSNLASLN